MQVYYLVDNQGDNCGILDRVTTTSKEAAEYFFNRQGWVIGDVMTEEDYKAEMDLNSYEADHC